MMTGRDGKATCSTICRVGGEYCSTKTMQSSTRDSELVPLMCATGEATIPIFINWSTKARSAKESGGDGVFSMTETERWFSTGNG